MNNANDNPITNPDTQPLNADHAIDSTARRLRQILETLAAHREAKPGPEIEDAFKPLDMTLRFQLFRPRWIQQKDAAAEDGVEQSLVASIREEGWRALAEGGLKAMRELADRACGDNGYLVSLLDHRWDGIGTDRRG
ncbi:MAG: hypothetical protein WA728_04145, partial [Xanthobacteraceae bacterium]